MLKTSCLFVIYVALRVHGLPLGLGGCVSLGVGASWGVWLWAPKVLVGGAPFLGIAPEMGE